VRRTRNQVECDIGPLNSGRRRDGLDIVWLARLDSFDFPDVTNAVANDSSLLHCQDFRE